MINCYGNAPPITVARLETLHRICILSVFRSRIVCPYTAVALHAVNKWMTSRGITSHGHLDHVNKCYAKYDDASSTADQVQGLAIIVHSSFAALVPRPVHNVRGRVT